MKNGTIVQTIWDTTNSKWYEKVVIWAMNKASGGPETHSQVWVDGWLYETAYPFGFRKRKMTPMESDAKYYLIPIRDLTKKESEAIKFYFEDKIRNKTKYGLTKLLVSFVFACLRPIFEKLKWNPFQDDRVWGEYCSAAVDLAYRFAGIDILPEGYEEITSPHDLSKSKFFRRSADAN